MSGGIGYHHGQPMVDGRLTSEIFMMVWLKAQDIEAVLGRHGWLR